MAKIKKTYESEFDRILASLTGGFKTDKEILINAISALRSKVDSGRGDKVDYITSISKAGQKLYALLLENGLNESDVINFGRLFDKIEVYIYEKRYAEALELIEILDSQYFFAPKDESGKKFYFLENIVDYSILINHLNKNADELSFIFSPRTLILNTKAKILILQEKFKEAGVILEKVLDFNPISFDAYIMQADLALKNKSKQSIEKFYDYVKKAHEVCYSKKNLIQYLIYMSKYYEKKEDFFTAYACLAIIGLYEDVLIVETALDRINVEINKRQTEVFKNMTIAEAKRILSREDVSYVFNPNLTGVVFSTYQTALVEDFNNVELLSVLKQSVEEICFKSPEIVKKIELEAKKLRKENKAE